MARDTGQGLAARVFLFRTHDDAFARGRTVLKELGEPHTEERPSAMTILAPLENPLEKTFGTGDNISSFSKGTPRAGLGQPCSEAAACRFRSNDSSRSSRRAAFWLRIRSGTFCPPS